MSRQVFRKLFSEAVLGICAVLLVLGLAMMTTQPPLLAWQWNATSPLDPITLLDANGATRWA
jgi:hypothetical protein